MILEDVAEIQVEIQDESESPDTIDIEILEAGPQGPVGPSVYDVYVQNGGLLSEEEWLANLKGDPGYTPVKGTDYWTEDDKNEVKSYCDSLIIDVLGGSY